MAISIFYGFLVTFLCLASLDSLLTYSISGSLISEIFEQPMIFDDLISMIFDEIIFASTNKQLWPGGSQVTSGSHCKDAARLERRFLGFNRELCRF